HPDMTQLSPDQRRWELEATAQAIHKVLGANYCLPYWRPPYGNYNAAVIAQTQAEGLTTILWNDEAEDWTTPGVQIIADRILARVRPGSIILLHDGPMDRGQTLQALPLILQGLKQRGLMPVTLPMLLAGGPHPTPTAPPKPTATPTPKAKPTPTKTP